MKLRILAGLLVTAVLAALTACGAQATLEPTKPAQSQPTTAAGQPTAALPATQPTAPAAALARGSCGTLRLLWWQAPTILNPHLSQGTKDYDASGVVYEGLAAMGPDGVPVIKYGLAAELPTLQNGGISADGKTITWKLKKEVKWSDGSPLTADDVVFTYQYVTDKATAAVTYNAYADIEKIEKVDDATVKITWKAPNSTPYIAFVGPEGKVVQKKAFQDFMGAKAKDNPANLKPIGTGPFKVREFKPGDTVVYDMNENFRDPTKPCFKEVIMKGGGDATSAARAVLQTGDVDWAWNLQVAADVLQDMAKAGKGEVVINAGSGVERIQFNRTNPDPALGDKRSELPSAGGQAHPFLSDAKVRAALTYGIDRQTIADSLYGGKDFTGGATCNIVVSPPPLVSTTKFETCEYNLDKANKLLDEAGWLKGADGVRAKGGVKMSVVFQTSVNPVRQKTQEIVKQSWEKLGIKVELKAVQAGVFFSSDVANPDTYPKFFTDVQMYTNNATRPDDIVIMRGWTCSEISGKSNEWRGLNIERYCNPEYDKIIDQLAKELDPAKRVALYKQANDFLINEGVMVPVVQRNGVAGKSKSLKGNVPNAWDSNLWNLQDWTNK